ncbi:MAG: macro domain-containing protein [Saezia sp.]
MKGIHYLQGDATLPEGAGVKIVAHICNDVGGWGKGFVLALSKRWLEPEQMYRNWYRDRQQNDFALGSVQLVQVESALWVCNMISQHGIGVDMKGVPPIRYEALEACLKKLQKQAQKLDANVHMPRIGCGLAGGRWERIEPLITQCLVRHGIDVYVYDYVEGDSKLPESLVK